MDELESRSTLTRIMNVTIERHEYVLPSVTNKKVTAAFVSSTEAFLTVGLALQLEVSTAATSIPGLKVREECWNSGLDAWLEVMAINIHLEAVVANIELEAVVVASSKSARLWETLPMTSLVLDPFENHVT
jgi:hypothetical protein